MILPSSASARTQLNSIDQCVTRLRVILVFSLISSFLSKKSLLCLEFMQSSGMNVSIHRAHARLQTLTIKFTRKRVSPRERLHRESGCPRDPSTYARLLEIRAPWVKRSPGWAAPVGQGPHVLGHLRFGRPRKTGGPQKSGGAVSLMALRVWQQILPGSPPLHSA